MSDRFISALYRQLPSLLLYANSTASLFIGVGAQTVGFVVLARSLGTEQYGYLATISAAANLAVPWCGLGAGEVIRRLVSRDRSSYPLVLGHCLILIGGTGVLLTALLSTALTAFVRVLADPVENFVLILMLVSCNTVLYTWLIFVEQIFLAHSDFKRANVVNASFGIARALTVVIACLGFGVDSLRSWAVWNAGVYIAGSLACVAAIWSYGRPRWQVLYDELTLGTTVSAAGLFWALRQNIDILSLSAVETPTAVGAYGIARRIIGTASVLGASLDRLIYQKLAVAGRSGPSATLPLARRYVLYGLAISAPTSAAIFIFSPLLPWIFGASYSTAILNVRVLCWALIFTVVQNIAFDALNASERHRTRFIVGSAAGLLGIGIIAGLIYHYGVIGAFIGSYMSDSIMVVSLWVTLYLLSRNQNKMHHVEHDSVV